MVVSEFRSCVKVEVAVLGFPSLWFPWLVSNTEPCSRIGLSLSLICQPTSEDIKQHRKEAHCQIRELVRQKQRGQEPVGYQQHSTPPAFNTVNIQYTRD